MTIDFPIVATSNPSVRDAVPRSTPDVPAEPLLPAWVAVLLVFDCLL
jgi:hypothetical protein